MISERFDAFVRAVSSARSRREAIRFAATAIVGLSSIPLAETGAVELDTDACAVGGTTCTRGGECCSGVCQKKKRKKKKSGKKRPQKGTCTSLGPLAADCPASNTCGPAEPRIPCSVNDEEGYCIGLSPNSALCAVATACRTLSPTICADDADCEATQGAGYKCLRCDSGCFGNRLCAKPAGAG